MHRINNSIFFSSVLREDSVQLKFYSNISIDWFMLIWSFYFELFLFMMLISHRFTFPPKQTPLFFEFGVTPRVRNSLKAVTDE